MVECGQFTGRSADGSESHCKKPKGHAGSCNPLHGVKISLTQDQIDISNLRFYAAMAHDFKWQTDIIHYSVVSKTLSEIADRLAHNETTFNGNVEPVFSGDPRGAVLKIRVPDGYFNDGPGGEGICVPS